MTTASAAMTADDAGHVRLAATMRLRADAKRVAEILGSDAPAWLGEPVDRGGPGSLCRYAIDLRLRVGGDAAAVTTFRKAAYLDLGVPRRMGDGWQVEVGWRASTAAPLFPVFFGLLSITPGELRIDGLYAPPAGIIGRVADRMLLHIAANATARWLLAEIDRVARVPPSSPPAVRRGGAWPRTRRPAYGAGGSAWTGCC